MTNKPTDTQELRDEVIRLIEKMIARGLHNAPDFKPVGTAELIVQKAEQYAANKALEAEALVRYRIHTSAPSVENRNWQDYDAFINRIWVKWAVENRARIKADGSAELTNKELKT